jgi:ribosomal protein S18 acetylase RimI-like enzyme
MSFESNESAPPVQVESVDDIPQKWDLLKEDVLKIETECFGDESLTEEDFQAIFQSNDAILALLKRGNQTIGFTFGGPDEDEENTLTIYSTAITSHEQGKGYVAQLMQVLESEARTKGYTFLSRYAAKYNGYADKIQKNYGHRVVDSFEKESELGPQQYFKIKL